MADCKTRLTPSVVPVYPALPRLPKVQIPGQNPPTMSFPGKLTATTEQEQRRSVSAGNSIFRHRLAFKVHGSPEADLVPPLKHPRLEVEIVNPLLRLRDDERTAFRVKGTCEPLSVPRSATTVSGTYSGRTTPNRLCRDSADRRPPKRDHHRGKMSVLQGQTD